MKNLKTLFLGIILISAFSFTSVAQKLETARILTSATCGACKSKIESTIAYEKGVKDANVDLSDKVLTVKYKSGKTTPEKLVAALQKIGVKASILKKGDKTSKVKCPHASSCDKAIDCKGNK